MWQHAQDLIPTIYELTAQPKARRDFSFADQIKRAVLSISNNIAEGFERQSNAELIKFLFYAKGSAGEVRSMCHAAYRLAYVTNEERDGYVSALEAVSKQISSFIKYLRTASK